MNPELRQSVKHAAPQKKVPSNGKPRERGPKSSGSGGGLEPPPGEHQRRVEDVNSKKNRYRHGDDDERAEDLRAGSQRRVVEFRPSAFGREDADVVCVPPPQRDLGRVEGTGAPAPAAAPGQSERADAGDGDEGHQGGDEGVGGLGFCFVFVFVFVFRIKFCRRQNKRGKKLERR